MFKFTSSLVFIGIVGLLQQSMLLFFGDVKPNFILIFLFLICSIYTRWDKRVIAIVVAAFSTKFCPGISLMDVTFIMVVIVGIVIFDMLPWRHFISYIVVVLIMTCLMYISFRAISLFVPELLLNIVIAGVIYYISIPFYEKEYKKKTTHCFR
ncbi:MAG: hypothetical protein V1652_01530 [bacterium]